LTGKVEIHTDSLAVNLIKRLQWFALTHIDFYSIEFSKIHKSLILDVFGKEEMPRKSFSFHYFGVRERTIVDVFVSKLFSILKAICKKFI